MALPLPRPTKDWNKEEIKTIYEDGQAALKFVDDTGVVSETYGYYLKRGRETIIEKMMELIMNTGYFKVQYSSSKYVLYWRDAPEGIAKFLQHLETVFTEDEKKQLVPAAGVVMLAANPRPRPTSDWSSDEIKIMYSDCDDAMKVLETNPAIISEKYRQRLKRGRAAIIEAMMEFIMNTTYFKIQYGSSKYVLYWRDAPDGLAKFLKQIETVFTRNK